MDDEPEPDVDPFEPPHEPARALSDEEAELRRLVDAGASTPDELRELAARLREHREREDSAWRREVRPSLVSSTKPAWWPGSTSGSATGADQARQIMLAVIAIVVVVVVVVVLVA